MKTLAPFGALLLTFNLAAAKAEPLGSPFRVDGLVHSFKGSSRGALIVGLTDGKHHRFRFYGIVSRSQRHVPDETTEFEIGSLSKIFTGLCLATLAQNNRLTLSDPLQRYLPSNFHAPRLGGTEIRLIHLATHTSGLPRDCAAGQSQPFEPPQHLFGRLEHCRLLFSPGSSFSYSNIGYEVLGQAIAASGHTSYEQLVKQNVLSPLHLIDTRVLLNAPQLRRLADGHDDHGRLMPHSVPAGSGASGGFRSTAHDLLALLDAELNANPGILAGAIECAGTPRISTQTGYYSCLGWFFDPDTKVYVKTGSLPGFRSYLAFSRSKSIGVVVLSASRQADVYTIGDQLIGASKKTHPEDITANGGITQ